MSSTRASVQGREVHVVTGASSGMGRATALRLARRGGVLVAADLSPIALEGFDGFDDVVAVRCDVTAPADVARLAEVASSAGVVRHVVHAAGISPTMGNASAMFSVDLIGSVHVVNAFEGIMAPGGSAVLVASMAGRAMPAGDATMHAMLDDPLAEGAIEAFIGSPQVGGDSGLAYAWSKRGVVRLASRLAAPWGRRGLRINSVSPGSIDTPMGQLELAAQPMMSGMLEQTPAGRLGRPDEIAAVIDFLLSDDASYVTGTDVLIDGGIMAAITS